MEPVLVLWDIDGTILRGGGVGRRAMEAAFREVLDATEERDVVDVDLGTLPFHGNTDPAIIGAGLELLGRAAEPRLIEAIGDAYLAILAREVATRQPFVRLPGVRELVDALEHAGFSQGLGTGNLEAAAWLKVDAVDLAGRFAFGGFGSDASERAELLHIGRSRGAARLGLPAERCRVVVVGDTLKDIAAARAIGAKVVAVATGGEEHATLSAAGPELLFESLDAADVAGQVLSLARR
jgi:phosphoglycolate phosphatase-like HAD superfamily hydrolase